MPRPFARSWILGALTTAVVVGLAIGASPWLATRARILAVRALVIAASKAPAPVASLLSTVLGLRGPEGEGARPAEVERGEPDAPILIVTTAANPFTHYLVEILQAEGLNALATIDVSRLSASELRPHDVVVLGETALTPAQVTILSEWTEAGGTLIAMRPARALGPLLGATSAGETMSDRYLQVSTTSGPGRGIVGEAMQFHGTADLWTITDARETSTRDVVTLATLYADADSASRFPAVFQRRVGSHGGVAAAFSYDLARSVVYTRQGNPAWAGQKRHGTSPQRTVDLFVGGAEQDWVDFGKIAIPQADEQQRLLANIILAGSLHRKPLPRFWYLPNGVNAAIVMTGDGHDDTGLRPRFERYREESPEGCSLEDWECVRATAYAYLGTAFTAADAERYVQLGFDVALHVNTNCTDWDPATLEFLVALQRREFHAAFPGIPLPSSNRTHCAAWSDWSTQPEVEAAHGMRFDTNYYFYPASWTRGRAGMFTGSGFPMRFAARDGTAIDCYQAATQIADESGLALPQVADELLERANGPEGYYGVFTTNMHFDFHNHHGSDAIVASAQARGVPVVSARQMLTWLDGRNGSTFSAVRWDGATLRFTIAVGTGARNLRAMVPTASAIGALTALTYDDRPITHVVRTIKGIDYAFFSASPGRYAAVYEPAR